VDDAHRVILHAAPRLAEDRSSRIEQTRENGQRSFPLVRQASKQGHLPDVTQAAIMAHAGEPSSTREGSTDHLRVNEEGNECASGQPRQAKAARQNVHLT
jgi:hypothetical protein